MNDEQNDADLARMAEKRSRGLSLLEDFKKWYHLDPIMNLAGDGILVVGLTRDILRGTESEIDRLTMHLEEKCQQALLKKMATGLEEA